MSAVRPVAETEANAGYGRPANIGPRPAMIPALRLAVTCALFLCANNASAEDQRPRREVFSGAEVGKNYATVYAGGGYAFGEGFDASGWRLRAVGAWGTYNYESALVDGSEYRSTTFGGQVWFLAAQAGYQLNFGRSVAKAFAGIEVVDQAIMPFDPGNTVQGKKIGFKATLETWTNITDRWFLCADASYGTAFQEYWQLTRIGYRFGPIISVGLEGGATGNQEYDAGRGGGFVRGTMAAIETTLSGGFTGDYLLSNPGGYIALSLYRKF